MVRCEVRSLWSSHEENLNHPFLAYRVQDANLQCVYASAKAAQQKLVAWLVVSLVLLAFV